MVRILHIVAAMNRGGIETLLMNLYHHIDRTRVQFDFLLHTQAECDYNQEIRDLGGRIYTVPSRRGGIGKNRQALADFFATHKEYKIVHQHVSSLSYVTPLKIAAEYGVPVRIVHSHNTSQGGSRIHKYIHLWNRMTVERFATDYFACSDAAARWLYGRKRCDKTGFYRLIQNGIDVSRFVYNSGTRVRLREELNLGNRFVAGHVGRFHSQKNHLFLLDVWAEVVKDVPDACLMLVGDGDLRPEIEKKIESLNLKANVVLMGVRSDVADLLNVMDVFIFPSVYEGLGIVLVEAQANGMPCVASTEVPREVKILDSCIFLSLSSPVALWKKEILKRMKEKRRMDIGGLITDAGYEIANVARELEHFYLTKS